MRWRQSTAIVQTPTTSKQPPICARWCEKNRPLAVEIPGACCAVDDASFNDPYSVAARSPGSTGCRQPSSTQTEMVQAAQYQQATEATGTWLDSPRATGPPAADFKYLERDVGDVLEHMNANGMRTDDSEADLGTAIHWARDRVTARQQQTEHADTAAHNARGRDARRQPRTIRARRTSEGRAGTTSRPAVSPGRRRRPAWQVRPQGTTRYEPGRRHSRRCGGGLLREHGQIGRVNAIIMRPHSTPTSSGMCARATPRSPQPRRTAAARPVSCSASDDCLCDGTRIFRAAAAAPPMPCECLRCSALTETRATYRSNAHLREAIAAALREQAEGELSRLNDMAEQDAPTRKWQTRWRRLRAAPKGADGHQPGDPHRCR